MKEETAKSDQGGLRTEDPYVISIERAGWRVIQRPPGGPTQFIDPPMEKAEATRTAVQAAKSLANKTGETVEVHIQDAKGRPCTTRYFGPTLFQTRERK